MDSAAQATNPIICPHCEQELFPNLSIEWRGYRFQPGQIITPQGRAIHVKRSASLLLIMLIRHAERTLSTHSLHHMLYSTLDDGGPYEKIIAVYICWLRKMLRDCKLPFRIVTVWGVGYSIFGAADARATTEHTQTVHS